VLGVAALGSHQVLVIHRHGAARSNTGILAVERWSMAVAHSRRKPGNTRFDRPIVATTGRCSIIPVRMPSNQALAAQTAAGHRSFRRPAPGAQDSFANRINSRASGENQQ
jgi:hypothetical protein